MMIPKKRVISGNCLHLGRELDSTYKRFRRAQRLPSPGRKEAGCVGELCIGNSGVWDC